MHMLRRLETDRELLDRYVEGDEAAFEALYKRHRRRLWGMARKMGRDLQQAEDILVEAMAAVALAARRGSIRGSFVGYSLTAIHHRGLHVIERRNERQAGAAIPLALNLMSSSPSPEERILRKDTRSQVAQAVDALPREEGIAVLLVDVQGLTYKECAAALSCSEATVKRRLREARRRLAMKLRHLRPDQVPVEVQAE
jgi:RNA polymerase sigma-70 factor (ECF subfamily)